MPFASGTLAYKGTPVVLTGTFAANGVAADPTTVTLAVKLPDGTTFTTTTGFTHTANTGVYVYTYTATLGGRYFVRWLGAGSVVAATEDYFDVQASAF